MNLEWFKEYFYNIDTLIMKTREKLYEYHDIAGVEEYENRLDNFFKENNFEKMNNNAKTYYQTTLKRDDLKLRQYDDLPFFKLAKKTFGKSISPIYIKQLGIVNYNALEAVSFLIDFNYYSNNKNEEIISIFKKVYCGNFIANLSKNVEEYPNKHHTKYSNMELFKKLKHVKFQDKRAKKMCNLFRESLVYPTLPVLFSTKFCNNIIFSATYLMACSAVKHDRNITCIDVALGYNLTFEILTTDLTEYIERDYNEKKLANIIL